MNGLEIMLKSLGIDKDEIMRQVGGTIDAATARVENIERAIKLLAEGVDLCSSKLDTVMVTLSRLESASEVTVCDVCCSNIKAAFETRPQTVTELPDVEPYVYPKPE